MRTNLCHFPFLPSSAVITWHLEGIFLHATLLKTLNLPPTSPKREKKKPVFNYFYRFSGLDGPFGEAVAQTFLTVSFSFKKRLKDPGPIWEKTICLITNLVVHRHSNAANIKSIDKIQGKSSTWHSTSVMLYDYVY